MDLPKIIHTPFGDGALATDEKATVIAFVGGDHIEAIKWLLFASDDAKMSWAKAKLERIETGR